MWGSCVVTSGVVSKLCVDKLCVDKLCGDKLCVSKLCVDKLCGDKLFVDQPSAISATPATQSDDPCREVPRLPRKVTVDKRRRRPRR